MALRWFLVFLCIPLAASIPLQNTTTTRTTTTTTTSTIDLGGGSNTTLIRTTTLRYSTTAKPSSSVHQNSWQYLRRTRHNQTQQRQKTHHRQATTTDPWYMETTSSSRKRVHPCACQPVRYEFTFDFSRTLCEETNIPELYENRPSRGIDKVECSMYPVIDDYVHGTSSWKRVTQIQLHEFGDALHYHAHPSTNKPGPTVHPNPTIVSGHSPFKNGQYFTYNSILLYMSAIQCTAATCLLPSRLHIHIFGETTNPYHPKREMELTWIFTKDCNYVPTIHKGQYVGPLVLTKVGEASEAFCAIVGQEPSNDQADASVHIP